MSLKIKKLSKKEYEKKRREDKENYNFYHYALFYMSKEGFDLFINELKLNHYHFKIYEVDNGDPKFKYFKLHLLKGKRYSLKEGDLEKIILGEDNGLIYFSVSWIDNPEWDWLSKCLESNNMKMSLIGASGGWDATPYYLVGDFKKDEKIKYFLNIEQNRKVYNELKWLKDEKNKFYHIKEQLELIEKLLEELGMKKQEILDYILKPNEYLFKRTVIEVLLTNQAEGLINMLKAKLGYPDAKPF